MWKTKPKVEWTCRRALLFTPGLLQAVIANKPALRTLHMRIKNIDETNAITQAHIEALPLQLTKLRLIARPATLVGLNRLTNLTKLTLKVW